MQTVHPLQTPSPFENLLVRYMSGQIADQSWARMMEAFDREDITAFERLAYARFMSDVVEDAAQRELDVPRQEEMDEILVEIRS